MAGYLHIPTSSGNYSCAYIQSLYVQGDASGNIAVEFGYRIDASYAADKIRPFVVEVDPVYSKTELPLISRATHEFAHDGTPIPQPAANLTHWDFWIDDVWKIAIENNVPLADGGLIYAGIEWVPGTPKPAKFTGLAYWDGTSNHNDSWGELQNDVSSTTMTSQHCKKDSDDAFHTMDATPPTHPNDCVIDFDPQGP